MSSTGILFGSSFMGTEQMNPSSSYQVGSSSYHLMYSLNTRLPPYGEQYAYSPYPPYSGGKPYVSMLLSLGQRGMTVCQWQPTMPVQPRFLYPSQPMQSISFILTTPIVTTMLQSQAHIVVSQPL